MKVDLHRVPVRHNPKTKTSIFTVLVFGSSLDDILMRSV